MAKIKNAGFNRNAASEKLSFSFFRQNILQRDRVPAATRHLRYKNQLASWFMMKTAGSVRVCVKQTQTAGEKC